MAVCSRNILVLRAQLTDYWWLADLQMIAGDL